MTATATARVEVLTAEVRVLMVGSRQVTLSVYAQLDQVNRWADIEPFGRVAPRGADADYVYVVGASARDADRGMLVRSRYWTAASWRRQAARCRRMVPVAREREALARELAEPELPSSRRWPLQQQIRQLDESLGLCDWSAAKLEETARESGEETIGAELWELLPLIVLAALR